MQDVTIIFQDLINEETTNTLLREIERIKPESLYLTIESHGGNVTKALECYEMLKHSPTDLTTHVRGICASAAILPFLAGKKRTCTPTAKFGFHSCSVTIPQKSLRPIFDDDNQTATFTIDILRNMTGIIQRDNRAICDVYVLETGISFERAYGLNDTSVEYWMGAVEAKELGFVHEII